MTPFTAYLWKCKDETERIGTLFKKERDAKMRNCKLIFGEELNCCTITKVRVSPITPKKKK